LNFDCTAHYILENAFVKLVPLSIEHIDQLLEIANEVDIWKYSFVKGDGKENLRNYIQSTINKRKEGIEYPFVVYDKIQKRFAGSTRFYEINNSLKGLRVGYTWYGKNFRGTGLNKHCKYLLFEFAFERLGAERIGLGAYIENEISIRAMESVGCQREGVLRAYLPAVDGPGRTDAIMLSILKKDWEMGAKLNLKRKLNQSTVKA
jgi:RimJ/RimL family protein N-acetyltransferase